MKLRLLMTGLLIALGCSQAVHAASGRLGFIVSTDGILDGGANTISSTPFDPTSLPQDQFLGRSNFSSRAIAVELILNAARLRNADSLIYRRQYNPGYRVTTHWRLRASKRRVTVRYEIRF